jgi:hypothetical protein
LKQYLLILFSIFSFPYVWGDAIGTWKVYPSYSDVSDIVPTGKDIFVLASKSLYSYNVNDGSLRTYSNNDVLNGCNIQNIAWVNAAKKLVITYSDYTIDLLSLNGDVENISALADKQTTDDKTINSIYVDGQYAYLATGFGIVKVNAKDATIADSYNLGYKVNYCYISGNYLYAASESKGLMKCQLTANLLNRNEWSSAGEYKQQIKEKYVYDSTNKCYWASDADSKLTKYQKEGETYQAVSTGVKPDGPQYNEHNYIVYDNGRILSVRGRYEYVSSDTNTPGFVQEYAIDSDTWYCYDNTYSTEKGKDCIAQTQISVDPTDRNHIMVAAKSGLYEYKDRKMVAYYDMNTDDPILSVINNVNYSVVTSTVYDKSGNLWIFNMGNDNILCLSSSGEWKSLQQSGLSTNDDCRIKKAFFDSRGLLWYANDNWKKSMFGFYDINSNQMRQITSFINQRGSRMLEAKNLFTVAEDKEHNIWVGCEVGAFYITPDDVTEMCSSTEMSNINIKQAEVRRNDGTDFIDYLLANVYICDIKVDNANRKWFATTNGVYLISSDSKTELAHFTMDNSPLPDNQVKSIAIDENNGMVYFGTLNGLCSYKSDVTKSYGNLTDDNVYAYPNPVTPDFTGDITITGLTIGAQVKILTTSGQLVNEGTCTSGSYLWNGCDRNGKKVASGVYMVNVATAGGESGIVTKISIVR